MTDQAPSQAPRELADQLGDAMKTAATPSETPATPLPPMTPPLTHYSHESAQKTPTGAAGDLVEKRIHALMALVETSNERYATREGVFAELCQMLRETLGELRTTSQLWQRMIAQLDGLEDGLSQSTAALIQMHQHLRAQLEQLGADVPPMQSPNQHNQSSR
jgi:hypothetical protein